MAQKQIVAMLIALFWPAIMTYMGVRLLNRPGRQSFSWLWYRVTFCYKNHPEARKYLRGYCGKRLLWLGVPCLLLSGIFAGLLIFRMDADSAFWIISRIFIIQFMLFVGTVIWSGASTKAKFIRSQRIGKRRHLQLWLEVLLFISTRQVLPLLVY